MGVLIFTLLLCPLFPNFSASVSVPLNSKLIIVSKEDGLLRLIERKESGYKTMSEYYISYGQTDGSKLTKDDYKTPIGAYFVTNIMTRTDIPDEMYGAAVAPLNYPNPIDKMLGKTGEGIWIHGIDRVDRLKYKATTKGCIILENKNLLSLIQKIRPNATPIIISDTFKDVTLTDNGGNNLNISVQDGSTKYKVTSTGLDKTNIIYEKI